MVTSVSCKGNMRDREVEEGVDKGKSELVFHLGSRNIMSTP